MCVICSISDIKEGIIRNKTLLLFAVLAVIFDCIYYIVFVQDLFLDFLPNILIIAIISLYLFYSHSFAGGDCKMVIALALLYPARLYVPYGTGIITLYFALGFAVIAGFIYLLLDSIKALVTKKVVITKVYVKNMIFNFLKSYVSAMGYILLINFILAICSANGLDINIWFSRLLCLLVAWCIGKFPALSRKVFIISAYSLVILLSLIFKTFQLSFNLESYLLILGLLFCQITIRSTIYENTKVENLKKGMILSKLSSALMQKSITKGLPRVSTENLKSRLSCEQVESVKIWARATHIAEISVVKKIPFAIFISIGFLSYLIIWSVVQ
ncbi:MAG: hypothetical protein WC196_04955 [Bacilli bacterium]